MCLTVQPTVAFEHVQTHLYPYGVCSQNDSHCTQQRVDSLHAHWYGQVRWARKKTCFASSDVEQFACLDLGRAIVLSRAGLLCRCPGAGKWVEGDADSRASYAQRTQVNLHMLGFRVMSRAWRALAGLRAWSCTGHLDDLAGFTA